MQNSFLTNIFIPAIILLFIMLLIRTINEITLRQKRKKQKPYINRQTTTPEINVNEINYTYNAEEEKTIPMINLPYKPKKILSKAEYSFYKALKNYMRSDAIILPKIGLKEFLYIPNGTEKFMTHWMKISQKHVDFLICDEESMRIYCAIELDDKSHDEADRIQRDIFVDAAIRNAGIAIIHLPCQYAYSFEDLKVINDLIAYKKDLLREIKANR